MAAPTVIKWTDSGAPSLTRTASSFINVLDYCLPHRGWVKEFSGTNKAVFRAGTGERKYYRILNDNTVYASSVYPYTYANVTAYDSMSDVDTGAGWGASQDIMLSFIDNVVRPWICVFDEKTVFIVTMPQALTSSTIGGCSAGVHAFGDTRPMLPLQTARAFIAAQLSRTSNTDNSAIYRLNVAGILVNRSIDGSRTAISSKLKRNGGDPGDNANSFPVGNWSYCSLTYPYNGSLVYGRPYVDDAIDYSMGDYIPGLYYPCHKGNGFNNAEIYTDVDTGAAFMAVLISGQATFFTTKPATSLWYYGAVLISLGDWDV